MNFRMRNFKIAVIGSGISGLSCAYYLSKNYKVDLFEKNSYFGGHTHTFLKEPLIIKNKNNDNVIINQVGSGGVYLGRIDFNFTNSSKNDTNSLLEV